MKILVISDSHGLNEELFQVLNHYNDEVDLLIHCGDSELPRNSFAAFDELVVVGGNCDFDQHYLNEETIQRNDLSIMVTHGHLQNVKYTLNNLHYRAQEVGAKLVCYGHSHVAGAIQEEGVIYVNPGSFRLPKLRTERSYAIVEWVDQTCTVRFFDHLHNEIPDLKCIF